MKRGTPEHPKTERLAEAIVDRWPMPYELAVSTACGILERLWHMTSRYAPRGDIGRHAPRAIARKVGWPGEPDDLIVVLRDIGWMAILDETLVVHDWSAHADDTCRKALEAAGIESFVDGAPVRRNREGYSRPTRDRGESHSRTVREPGANSSPPSGANSSPPPSLTKPSLAKPSQAKQQAAPRQPRATIRSLPEDFVLAPERRAFAEQHGCANPEEAFAAFRDYWRGAGKRKGDWPATWRNWIRNAHDRGFGCVCSGQQHGPRGSPTAVETMLAEEIAREETA